MEMPKMPPDNEITAAAEDAAFESGFPAKGAEKPPEHGKRGSASVAEVAAKADAPVAKADVPPEAPDYVQISKKDWEEVKAAAARTASYDSQFSKAFGTIGNLQKMVNGFQDRTPAGRKVEVPKDAFAEMERDFPELARHTRTALEAALAGMTGTSQAAEVDPAKIEGMLASYTAKREVEALEDAYPDWRTIVGAVDISREQPPADNGFRKWLGTKDAAYQTRVNTTESAAVIGRAIRLYQNETKASRAAAGKAQDDARRARIGEAVQPRGDRLAAPPGGKSDEEEFEAGFNSR